MTEHDLKEMKNLGAELGAAKAENDRLRGLLQQVVDCQAEHYGDGCGLHLSMITLAGRIKDALSQQAESECRCTMRERTVGDGCSVCNPELAAELEGDEPAPAQDEQPAVLWVLFDATGPERFIKKDVSDGTLAFFDSEDEAQRAKRRHPGADYKRVEYYRAPIAQTAPQGKFRMGDLVRKTSGSEWQGRICGTYSTALTPEGYAVESEAHAGSVQIYPAKALEAVR